MATEDGPKPLVFATTPITNTASIANTQLANLINNPQLSISLSPAELDDNLLALYRQLGKGEFGDLLRVIGGGGRVGRQTIYMKEEQWRRIMGQEL